jgi:hypothetical protein
LSAKCLGGLGDLEKSCRILSESAGLLLTVAIVYALEKNHKGHQEHQEIRIGFHSLGALCVLGG